MGIEIASETFAEQLGREMLGYPITRLEDIFHPCWDGIYDYIDWRYYIDDYLRKHWTQLSRETRIVAYCMAEKQASEADYNLKN